RLVFFFIFARLITMRRYYLTARAAHEAAEEVSRLKSNMISLVSHEYGNALTNMKLAMDLLRHSEPAPPETSREHAYEVLDRAIEHLRVATANFLNLNRLQSGHLKLNVCRTRMRTVASETLLILQPIIESKHLRLKIDFPTTPVPVQADPDALSLIMSNLMTNAVKYTPSGGSITIRIAKEDGPPPRARFSVEDTGIGISEPDRERILTGFYRTEESRKVAKGFGVGLMLVNELIERHGSQLQIESQPGQGARFYFYLPLWEEAAA
ncbi:MAG: HAMP domain-containing sensor histidine kinase, partial [Elusimicrobiota bacterium]